MILQDKVALVTGGASELVAAAIAYLTTSKGGSLVELMKVKKLFD